MILFVQTGLPSSEGSENVDTTLLSIGVKKLTKAKTIRQLTLRQHGFSLPEAVALAEEMISEKREKGVIWVEYFAPGLGRVIQKPLCLDHCSPQKVFLTEVCLTEEHVMVFPQGMPVYFRQN